MRDPIVFVTSLPLPAMAALCLGTTLLLALAGAMVARGLRARLGRDMVLAVPPVGFCGVLFSLVTAFLAANVWDDTGTARRAVAAEAAALRSLNTALTVLPADEAAPVWAALSAYVAEVVGAEWPAMSGGAADPAAGRRLAELRRAVRALPSSSDQLRALHAVDSITEDRDHRLILAWEHTSPLKWLAVLVMGSLFLTLLPLSLAARGRGVALALTALCMGTILFTVAAYDRPFTGPQSVSPRPLLDAAVPE
ncbi:DUF4239 domain-containing protein [Siccirubricoccus sp. G192]|uniref:bestrophin-like domain n=1 Tax=Siccirubricoccus sp. G192 TaxID=2849651 RepID=UPI001C2B7FAF|nr:DUF4239 domain-containing protein [Siccirubricoccus sp. G192]MBV1796877.1 DUF4239 domain-containing protein [Siccirubricoccus sp. G192]